MQTSVFSKALNILWPIENKDLKKFLPMAFIMFFTLFNYTVLRSLKDALVVPNIGAEAISFIKSWVVPPAAVLFMLIYARMTASMNQQSIFYSFAIFFLVFFAGFALILYPYADIIHPDPAHIEHLSKGHLNLVLFSLDLAHFKWFVKLYGKWSFVLFYVLAELWGSVMLSLLFWQFANQITKTSEAKKFYPMFGFIGNLSLPISGVSLQYFSKTSHMVGSLVTCVCLAVVAIMLLYRYMNSVVLADPRYAIDSSERVTKKKKPTLSLSEGLKVVFSSKYLGLIAILLLSYGISINLVEGPWKAKVKELYPDQNSYTHFMGTLQIWTGSASVIAMLIGANILKRISWFSGAILTPLMILVTGTAFFIFGVFHGSMSAYMGAFSLLDPLVLAVMFGLTQNVLSKATKYSFFDPTKEMAYIPIDDELKTKGKAAVDIIGARFAKSGGAWIQSFLFIIFPTATFVTLTPYLMVVFIAILIIWLVDVKLLAKEYEKHFVGGQHKH